MTWDNAKTTLDTIIQNTAGINTAEIEVDGHRVKNRSVKELVDLADYICHKQDEEVNGPTNLTKAGFKTTALNCGDGLI